MIPKSGDRFSQKIMLKQQAKAKSRLNLISFRFSGFRRLALSALVCCPVRATSCTQSRRGGAGFAPQFSAGVH
jgi:hypothetical protein